MSRGWWQSPRMATNPGSFLDPWSLQCAFAGPCLPPKSGLAYGMEGSGNVSGPALDLGVPHTSMFSLSLFRSSSRIGTPICCCGKVPRPVFWRTGLRGAVLAEVISNQLAPSCSSNRGGNRVTEPSSSCQPTEL